MSLDKIIIKLNNVLAKAKNRQLSRSNDTSNNQLSKELFVEINDLLQKVIDRMEKK
tara:strand:+ start:76 stop:243 length:168 start_codon:yes stop_codon:yes gene_type:complete